MSRLLLAALFLLASVAQGQERTLSGTLSHSEAAGFKRPSAGVELLIDSRYLRLEAAAASVEKVDGGAGFIASGVVAANVQQTGLYVGVRYAVMDVELYQRNDIWLVLGWEFVRLELEEDTQYLEFRPSFKTRRFVIRPSLGYVHGRGADGVVGAVAVGYRFGKGIK